VNKAVVFAAITASVLFSVLWAYRHIANTQRRDQAAFLWQKHGRVIDSSSGTALEGATIVANWRSTIFSLHTSYNCHVQRVVTTDRDGNYVLPDVSDVIDVTQYMLPRVMGTEISFHWDVTVYKAGYMRESEYLRRGATTVANSHYQESSAREEPRYTLRDHEVEIANTGMREVSLTPEETILYDGALLSAASCNAESGNRDDAYVAWRTRLRNVALKVPCDLPGDEVLSRDLLASIAYLGEEISWDAPRNQHQAAAGVGITRSFLQLIDSSQPVTASAACAALHKR
jgi:hypothetical protein